MHIIWEGSLLRCLEVSKLEREANLVSLPKGSHFSCRHHCFREKIRENGFPFPVVPAPHTPPVQDLSVTFPCLLLSGTHPPTISLRVTIV